MLHVKIRGARGRIAASLAASLGLVAAAGAVTTGPAASVPPSGDCPTAFPAANVVRDQPVEGLTVTQGTQPTEFSGKVIGPLEDGIAPGIDMIMMELDSPAIERVGGIWQGMSGSPVYDTASGDLIGAVAYGLAWGPSPVAGITPYEDMDNYLDPAVAGAARQVDVSNTEASRIAAASDVTAGQASEGFSRLRIPRTFAGVTGWRLERAATQPAPHGKARPYIVKNAGTASGAGAAVDASAIVAGGNLGATFAYGDITAGGVGTITSVCGGRLVGFGHPMMFSGKSTLSLHPADALYVQEDSLGSPFKVANLGAPVGTIDQDRTTGISGSFGEGQLPDTMQVTSNLSYPGATPRSGTTYVSVPAAAAEMTFYQQLANHDRVIDGFTAGSEQQKWTITGTDHGAPFSISSGDLYSSDYDIAFESPWDVADTVWTLSGMAGVDIDSVDITGEIVDDHSIVRVVRVQQQRGGQWVTLSRRMPAMVTAGNTLNLRAVLEDGTRERIVRVSMPVPARAARGEGMVAVVGGGSSWNRLGNADTVDQLEEVLSTTVRNDQVEGQLFIDSRHGSFERRDVTDPTHKVVLGHRLVGLIVR